MGLQMQITSILRFSWSILVKMLCSSANELQQNSEEDYIPQILAVFIRDSSRLHLTFAAFCLLSVIRKQKLKQWNYSVHHLELLTGFRTDFTSSLLPFAGEDIIPPTYRVRIRLAIFVPVVQVCSILSFSSIEGVCSIQWLLCHYLSCFEGGFLLLSSSLDVLLTLLLSFNILLLFPEKRLPFPACFLLF